MFEYAEKKNLNESTEEENASKKLKNILQNTNSEPNNSITPSNEAKEIRSSGTWSIPSSTEMNYSMIDDLLEKEKQKNKTETWNKLDKTIKIQKLHAFSEKYGNEHSIPLKDIKSLKSFFIDCLEKNKLQKTKDVNYDKDAREIISIPSLYFNTLSNNFTLKNIDPKRVSTLKSLTPKRSSDKLNIQSLSDT